MWIRVVVTCRCLTINTDIQIWQEVVQNISGRMQSGAGGGCLGDDPSIQINVAFVVNTRFA